MYFKKNFTFLSHQENILKKEEDEGNDDRDKPHKHSTSKVPDSVFNRNLKLETSKALESQAQCTSIFTSEIRMVVQGIVHATVSSQFVREPQET